MRDELRSVVKESGVSALIVTHDTRDALSVADTLAVLKDGRLEQVGSPERFIFTRQVNILPVSLVKLIVFHASYLKGRARLMNPLIF